MSENGSFDQELPFFLKYLIKNFEKREKYGKISLQKKFLPLQEIKKCQENPFKASKNGDQELRKMLKKQQKLKKIKQKKAILMSEKISVTLMNKGFS